MYNSVNRVCKSIKYIYWVKQKTCLGLFERCDSTEDIQKEESSHKNHYDDNYSASITRCSLLRLNTYPLFVLVSNT